MSHPEVTKIRDAFKQFSRNFRWGTCVDCPRDSEGATYPEFCQYTTRYDHNLGIESLTAFYDRVKLYNLHK